MYRPPSANVEYFTNMLDLLDQINSNNNNVILLGDLNHDYDSSGHPYYYTKRMLMSPHKYVLF